MGNTIFTELEEYAKQINKEMLDSRHFFDFRNNIFPKSMSDEEIKMFMAGDGNELVAKACAVNSSSMLGYNFFHWINKKDRIKIRFKDEAEIEYSEVMFEVKIPVLNDRNKTSANMDIVLLNEAGDVLFIESKFLEYCNTQSFKLSETYTDKGKNVYFTDKDKWIEFLDEDIKGFVKKQGRNHYWDGIKQEICHLIGISNIILDPCARERFCLKDRINFSSESIRFINLVFAPKTEYDENGKFSDYQQLYQGFHELINTKIPKSIKMSFMTYDDLWEQFNNKKINNVSSDLMTYLYNHYMAFSSYREQ